MDPVNIPANGSPTDVNLRELQAEIDRLRSSLNQAEQRISKLQEERDNYHAIAMVWIRENCKEEDWADFNPDDYTVTMDELIADAEAMLKQQG